MNGVIALSLVSLLLLGCTQPSSFSMSTFSPTVYPSPGTPEAQKLPIEQARQAMIAEMEKTGGNPTIAKEPVVQDQEFQGMMVRSGTFENLNYMTSGSVRLETQDGKTFIVFGDDFTTPNGPDLVVYLTKNASPSTREDIQAGLELGKLKNLKGKQVYELPAGTDALLYRSVTIHCKAFNVPWSYALLK